MAIFSLRRGKGMGKNRPDFRQFSGKNCNSEKFTIGYILATFSVEEILGTKKATRHHP